MGYQIGIIMSDVFISYAREDYPIARLLAEYLHGENLSVFWDREIPVGDTWESFIEKELLRASCVVVLWSTASVASGWVRSEAAVGAERGVLAPALISTVSLPLRFRTIQSANLVGWHGRQNHEGLANLIAAVREFTRLSNEDKFEKPAFALLPGDEPIGILEVELGADQGRSFKLTKRMTSLTIGRSRDCDIVLDDYYISRSHCRIHIEPIDSESRTKYRFTLIDFGSASGTKVNNKPVDRAILQHGDRLQIGSVCFRFRAFNQEPS
jgi:hypothetical protein